MRRASFVAAVLAVLMPLGGAGCRQAPPPAQAAAAGQTPPGARLQGSYRFERDGWIFVHLEGPPNASASITAT